MLLMKDLGSSQEKLTKLQKILTNWRLWNDQEQGMSEHKCWGEESLEKKRQFFLDMVMGQNKKEKMPLL